MRHIARAWLLVVLLATASATFAREPFQLPGSRPTSIQQVDEAMRGEEEETSIPAYLEGAQCGGWDKETGVAPYIANVWGVPGRRHDWSGDIRSGMGVRIDGDGDGDTEDEYEFPDSTRGLTTACEQGKDTDWKEVLLYVEDVDTMDGPVARYEWQDIEFAYPYFEDPPCQWRISVGRWPPVPLEPWERFDYDRDGWETEDEESCRNFCGYLNDFVYHDCMEPVEVDVRIFDGFNEDGEEEWHWETVQSCDREGEKYVCTDAEVDWNVHEFLCDVPLDDLEEWSNARYCQDEGCRCPTAANPDACWWVEDARGSKHEYQSYYRLYSDAGYSRDGLWAHAPRDDSDKDLDVTCFGFYDEFDPKTHRTEEKDRRCVINVDVEDMRETQEGKAEYKESDVEDKDPTDPALQRPGGENDEPGVFDDEKDTWYKKLGGAFSFVNEKVFQSQYDGDLGNVFLAFDELDDGMLEATPQISDNRMFAESNLMRAFDDTGNPRAYTRWWQEQQTRMAALMRPPVLRIILPSAWFMGLDPDDPFLTNVSGAEDATDRADRSDRIELQIEADEDVLGTALAYLERSVLLHIEEEPIPVIVPMGSPAEFRARAADWCNWHKTTANEKTCDDAPEDVKKVMERLEEYAARIDEYRELRAEVALTTGAALDLQHELLRPIAEWFQEHEEQLLAIVRGRERVEQELLPVWRDAQASIARMHERSNQPWCMNQRFTAPTYSLLDPWLQSRASGGAVNEIGLPTLPIVERPVDVILDFSAVTAMSGTLKMPVLKPVQVRIDIPTPPHAAELPELPPVAGIREAMENAIGQMPEVVDQLEDPPDLEPPAPLSGEILSEAQSALNGIERVASEMNERYEKFWKSIGPIKPGEEQFDRQIEFKTQMKCFGFDTLPCEHVEMDLWERIQRIGSRPMVHLFEDFDSVGTARTEPTNCLPDDDACHILNAERSDPGFRWEVRGSRSNDAPIDELKLRIIQLTQPPPLGTVDPLILAPHDDDPSPLRAFPSIRLIP